MAVISLSKTADRSGQWEATRGKNAITQPSRRLVPFLRGRRRVSGPALLKPSDGQVLLVWIP